MRWFLWIFLLLGTLCWAEPVEVTIFEGGEGLDFYQAVGEEFARQFPGSQAKVFGDPAIADKMRMRVLEGNFPEVTNANVDVWALKQHGHLQALDAWLDAPALEGEGTWRDSFLPGSLSQYQSQGKTYGVPLVYVIWSVYYNKAVFREQGWTEPRTWDEFFELCQKMRAKELAPVAFQGRYPFYARPLVEHTYFQLVGRQTYEKQQAAEPGSFNNPAMVRALTILDRLRREAFQEGSLGMSHTEAQLEFFQGRAGMLFCGSWLFSEMRDNIPDDFELGAFSLPLPESEWASASAQYASSGFFFVFSSSKNPQGGVDYLRLLTALPQASRFAVERGIPVAVKGANSGLHPAMKDVARQLELVEETFGPRSGPSLKGLDQVWTDKIGEVLAGSLSPEQAAIEMERQVSEARRASVAPDSVELRHPRKALGFVLFLILGFVLAVFGLQSPQKSEGTLVSPAQVGLFTLPAVLVFSVFFVLPSLVALAGALVRWDGLGRPEFVAWLHFKRLLLESDLFWSSLGHNLILMFVPALVVLPLALFLASLLHQGVVGARIFRIAFFFPNLIGVAGVLLWQQLYNPQIGPINRILVGLGLTGFENFAWLSNENLYYALVPMAVWSAVGFNMVLFLAAMQSVPESLYEAADIHGADSLQKFFYITLPLIVETLTAATILMIIGGMKAFEAIWLLTNQAPSSDTHVVGTLMVRSLFVEQRIGQAAALACLLFAVVLVGSVLAKVISTSGRAR